MCVSGNSQTVKLFITVYYLCPTPVFAKYQWAFVHVSAKYLPRFPFSCLPLSQFLVQRDADLFAENENRETPCDCAEKQHHKELALCLESQMVFSLVPEAEGVEAEYAALDRREVQA